MSFPHRHLSILAAAYHLSIPVTVHVGIGYDIVHEHPNCDGAAYGAASYRDFLIFAHTLERLEGGVVLTFGSAIMAPEVYLKALAMVRNVAHQHGKRIRNFTTAVFDSGPFAATSARNWTRPIRAITSGRTRPFWCAPWPMAARVIIFRAIIAPRCRLCARSLIDA